MLGLRISPNFHPPLLPSISNLNQNPNLSTSFQLNPHPHPKRFRINVQNDNGNKNGVPTEKSNNGGNGDGDGDGDGGEVKNGRAKLNIKWVDLVLDRDPDNLVAVGLTGLLTWASVQVLWQLFVISAAILIAAVKYSVVAALLIVILITLL